MGIVNGVQKMQANRDLLLPTPLFVLGKTNVGDKVKLRWYPKEHFVGITPRNEMYAYSGVRWLAGFVVAPDGATNLNIHINILICMFMVYRDVIFTEMHVRTKEMPTNDKEGRLNGVFYLWSKICLYRKRRKR